MGAMWPRRGRGRRRWARAATLALATAISAGLEAGTVGHADPRDASARRAEGAGDRVLLGPRLLAGEHGAQLVWLEEPRTLIVADIDAGGRLGPRRARMLPELDARTLQLEPFRLEGGALGIVVLESGVRRPRSVRALRRVVVWRLDDVPDPLQVLAEAWDDDLLAPAAIVGAGPYTAMQLPTVLWRRAAHEFRLDGAGPAVLTILRGQQPPTHSELVADGRMVTAVAFRDDGAALIAVSDAGRASVLGPDGEAALDLPTPAVVTQLVTDPADGRGFAATGIDGAGRVFAVAGTLGQNPLARYLPPEAALVAPPPDPSEGAPPAAAPILRAAGRDLALVWAVARGEAGVELRARRVPWGAAAGRPSVRVGGCGPGAQLLAMDAVVVQDQTIVAWTCATGGRATLTTRTARLP